MKANTVQTISFVRTKGGYIAAIINNQISVVKREGLEPLFNLYYNEAKGSSLPNDETLENEFKTAYLEILAEKEKALEEKRNAEILAERKRIEEIESSVKAMTPQEFAEYYNISTVETASHWSDLYEGRSSFAFNITSHEENELVEIASSINDWGGEFGELKNRAGEHHNTFNRFYDLEDYQKGCENYINDNFNFKSKKTEESFYFEVIKEKIENEEITTIEEISDFLKDFENMEEGYYDGNENLVFENFDFKNFFGYSYDVYYYNFGYRLPSKEIFYNGKENEDEK